jgi:hypothetical protein
MIFAASQMQKNGTASPQNDAFEKCSNSNTSSPKTLKNHSNSQRHFSRDAKRAGKAAKPQSLKADSFTLWLCQNSY